MSINETLESLRVNYRKASLDIGDCSPHPEAQFDLWFDQAMKSSVDEPNAFVLSTAIQNKPRARVVLLKGIQHGQFVFYTNYDSAKGQELETNAFVSMTFLWLPLQRQIRIEGMLSKVSSDLSDEYFQKRPRGSQLGAIASPQSRKVVSRSELEKLFSDTETKFSQVQKLERPSNWGGYGISPTYFEFWQGRDNRMHDRIAYEKKNQSWELSRLAP